MSLDPIINTNPSEVNMDSTAYMAALSTAKSGLQQTQYEADTQDISTLSQLRRNYDTQVLDRSLIYQSLLAVQARWAAVVTAQTNMNQTIGVYDAILSVFTSQINNVNSKITAYVSALTLFNLLPNATNLAALNTARSNLTTAINQYNSSTGASISQYQGFANSFNAAITDIPSLNDSLTLLGIPTLPVLSNAPTPTAGTSNTPIASSISTNPLPTTLLATPANFLSSSSPVIASPPAASSMVSVYGANAVTVFNNSIGLSSSRLQRIDDQLVVETNPDDPTLPDAPTYTTRASDLLVIASDGVPTGNGASLITRVVGLSARRVGRILGNAVYRTTQIDQGKPLTPSQIDALQLFSLNVIEKAADSAGAAVGRQIGNLSIKAKGPRVVFELLSAVAFANAVHETVSALPNAIKELLDNSPAFASLSSEEREKLVGPLAAAVNASLSQISLIVTANAAQAPGLLAQILGNIPGVTVSADTIAARISAILDNPEQAILFKQALSDALVKAGFTREEANLIASRAVNRLLSHEGFSSLEELQEELLTALKAQGLSSSAASSIAGVGAGFVNTEVTLPFLSEPYNPGTLTSSLTAPVASTKTALTAPLTDALVKNSSLKQEEAAVLTAEVLDSVVTDDTVRSAERLNEAILGGFIKAGITPEVLPFIGNAIENTPLPLFATLPAILRALGPEAVAHDLLLTLSAEGIANADVAQALSQTLEQSKSFNTIRDFRNKIVELLQTVGTPITRASGYADVIATPLAPELTSTSSPLVDSRPSKVISQAAVHEALSTHILALLTPILGNARALEYVNSLSRTLSVTQQDLVNDIANLRKGNKDSGNALIATLSSLDHFNPADQGVSNAVFNFILIHPDIVSPKIGITGFTESSTLKI